MYLSPEQQILIRKHVAADSPSPAMAYGLWLVFGLFGAHYFYLRRAICGFARFIAAFFGLVLVGLGIAFGGTPADGLFYEPSLSDILRSSQSGYGLLLFYSGAAIFAGLIIWWLADAFFIRRFIQRIRARKQQNIIAFYQQA